MATQTISYGTEAAFSSASNINSLASAAAKPLGAVDNSSALAVNYRCYLKVTLNSTGVSSTGTLSIYLLESTDNSNWSDGISPSGSSDIASSVKNAKLLAVLTANANNQVIYYDFDILGDLQGVMRDCPKYFSLVLLNSTGAALNGSGNAITNTPIKYTVA
jgi:hypothetical protein